MPLTPETLPRHELNGLYVRVVDAPNPDLIGIAGRIVVETANTLHIESVVPQEQLNEGGNAADSDIAADESRVRQVPKQGSIFEFVLEADTDEAAAPEKGAGIASKLEAESTATPSEDGRETDADGPSGEGVTYVTVDGSRLLSRPAERTETRGTSPWQLD
ncbi:ribonuclease P protein component 1 [Natronoarchaeum sp. GCM10025703]|uniref:ribonuclease P protein component 1 n=1 Tax=unclassified Natronoarchaeum TaxID=2620183 RepID=UPI00361162B8